MKQLAFSALLSLVTGLCFGLGVYGAVLLLEDEPAQPERNLEFVQLPPGLIIAEHERVPNTPYFTIRGVIRNEGMETWQSASLSALVKASDAKVNDCDTRVRGGIEPGSSRAFLLECIGVAGTNTPENLSYEISIRSAGR